MRLSGRMAMPGKLPTLRDAQQGASMVYTYWRMFRTIAYRGFRADGFQESPCQQRYFASIRMSRNRIG